MLKTVSLQSMKNTVSYLFIVFLATLVFYGGAGVNLITYCCGDCRTEGIEVLLDDKCCEVHGHEHSDDAVAEVISSSCESNESACCNIERVSFDWKCFSIPTIELQPAVVDLLSSGFLQASLLPAPAVRELVCHEQESPPVVCPRIYLSLLTTLLI